LPTVLETTVTGFASCWDPKCPGYEQEVVDVVRREVLYMREEYGGDIPGIDRSTIAALDQSVEPCGTCGGPRIASLTERPEYAPISGQDPLALLDINQQKRVREVQTDALKRDVEIANLRADLAEMKALLARSRPEPEPQDAEVVEPVKRGPGRPRKDDTGR